MDTKTRHEQRMAHMPWLYHRAKPEIRAWAEPWQADLQARLAALESVRFGPGCFVAPDAGIFAEPNRPIVFGARCSIAAGSFVHGPVTTGDDVSLNVRSHLDGGRAGIVIGDGARIAAGVRIFAWNHGMGPDMPIRDQPTTSRGIRIGCDVWIGAGVGIVDGVSIGDHAVVGMHAVVTRDVEPWQVVAGNPARPIGDRRAARRS